MEFVDSLDDKAAARVDAFIERLESTATACKGNLSKSCRTRSLSCV
jgi:hypothetical protein